MHTFSSIIMAILVGSFFGYQIGTAEGRTKASKECTDEALAGIKEVETHCTEQMNDLKNICLKQMDAIKLESKRLVKLSYEKGLLEGGKNKNLINNSGSIDNVIQSTNGSVTIKQ